MPTARHFGERASERRERAGGREGSRQGRRERERKGSKMEGGRKGSEKGRTASASPPATRGPPAPHALSRRRSVPFRAPHPFLACCLPPFSAHSLLFTLSPSQLVPDPFPRAPSLPARLLSLAPSLPTPTSSLTPPFLPYFQSQILDAKICSVREEGNARKKRKGGGQRESEGPST